MSDQEEEVAIQAQGPAKPSPAPQPERGPFLLVRTLEFSLGYDWEFRLEISRDLAVASRYRWDLQLRETVYLTVAFHPAGFVAIEDVWVDFGACFRLNGQNAPDSNHFEAKTDDHAQELLFSHIRLWAVENAKMLSRPVLQRPRF